MTANNDPHSHYNRNRQPLNQWLQSLYSSSPKPTLLSPQPITQTLCTLLLQSQPPKPSSPSESPSPDQLWSKNEYFMQCLNDISEDILYYVYVGDCRRKGLPKCLIGYYEVVKNCVWIAAGEGGEKKEGESGRVSKKGRNRQGEKQAGLMPPELQIFLKQKLLRIILSESPYSYLRLSLSKLQQNSIITQNFRTELSSLLTARFTYFCKLFSILPSSSSFSSSSSSSSSSPIPSTALTTYLTSQLLDSQEEPQIEISLDSLMLCIIYSVYKLNHYTILFSTIIEIYEEKCEFQIDREALLGFFNGQFIIKGLPMEVLGGLTVEMKEKGEKGDGRGNQDGMGVERGEMGEEGGMGNSGGLGFQREQVKEQKSIYDMFQ